MIFIHAVYAERADAMHFNSGLKASLQEYFNCFGVSDNRFSHEIFKLFVCHKARAIVVQKIGALRIMRVCGRKSAKRKLSSAAPRLVIPAEILFRFCKICLFRKRQDNACLRCLF